jgi:competence protein ComEA
MIRTMARVLLAVWLAAVPLAAQDGGTRQAGAKPAAAASLNLNTATAAQLEALPGIGKATADRIVEYRQKSGSFKRIEDLMNVRGIGEKAFLRLKPLVTVGAAGAER